jgi:Holliday junction resolvase RusA-like endonuclease
MTDQPTRGPAAKQLLERREKPPVTELKFTVLGRPQPAGSKRVFGIRRRGEPTGRFAVVDDNERAKPWQALVKAAAEDALEQLDDPSPLLGPVALEVVFYVARPQAHYGTGRNQDRLKPSAPAYPTVRPDATKLLRGLEDALTGLVWRDDAQVVVQVIAKRYGSPDRSEVKISTLRAFRHQHPAGLDV